MVAVDASSPAVATQATNTVATVTTVSFTPPANSLLLIQWSCDQLTGGIAAPTITDNLGTHLTYTLTDWQSLADSPNAHGQSASWTAPVATSQAMTVTVTTGSVSGERVSALKISVMTDPGGQPLAGAHGKAGSTSASSIAQNYTAQRTGGMGFIGVDDFDQIGAESAGTGCTLIASANVSTAITYGFVRRTNADDSGGATNTLNVTIPGTSTNLNWTYVEIIPPSAAGDLNPTWVPGFMVTMSGLPPALSTPGLMRSPAAFLQLPWDTGAAAVQNTTTLTASLGFTTAETLKTSVIDTATVSFTSADAVRTAKTVAVATVSFTGALTRKVVLSAIVATLSFVGALSSLVTHFFTQTLTASLSFTSAQLRSIGAHFASSVSFTSAQTRAVRHTLSGSLAFTGTTTRTVAKALTATVSFVGALVRRTSHPLSATISFTGSLASQAVHFFTQALSATLSFTSVQPRSVSRTQAASVSFAGAQTRRTTAVRTASIGFTAADAFRTSRVVVATLSFTSAQTRRVAHALAGTLSFTGSLATQVAHFFTQALSATLSFTGVETAQHIFTKSLAATLSFVGATSRRTNALRTATVGFTGAQARRIGTLLAATLRFAPVFTIVPNLLSALSNLRVRIFGREPRNAEGREPGSHFAGQEPGGASGREPAQGVSYKRADGPIGGREDGT